MAQQADALSGPAIQPAPRTLGERITRVLNKAPIHIALAIVALIWLLPTIGLLVTSFRPRTDIQNSGWWEIFQLRFTTQNYEQVLFSQGLVDALINTVWISVPSTIIPLLLACMAAYAFAWLRFPARDWLFLLVVAMLMVPVQVAFIPVLTLFRILDEQTGIGLLRGYGAVWLAHTAFALPFGIFLLRNFFITLPRDLIEAARIDGASDIGIFRTIVLPLSVPAIAAYGIFQFLWVWNDLLMALVFVQDGDKWPLTRQIQSLLSFGGAEWHLLAAGAFILMGVPLLVFFSLQRYFVQGLLAGSVK